MEIEKHSFIKWINTNKGELIIAGISITAIIVVILEYKNSDELMNLWQSLKEKIGKMSSCNVSLKTTTDVDAIIPMEPSSLIAPMNTMKTSKTPQEVNSHIRNLPKGWNASPEKIATAAENGYLLQCGQTWVNNYTKYKMTA